MTTLFVSDKALAISIDFSASNARVTRFVPSNRVIPIVYGGTRLISESNRFLSGVASCFRHADTTNKNAKVTNRIRFIFGLTMRLISDFMDSSLRRGGIVFKQNLQGRQSAFALLRRDKPRNLRTNK
jgi:hypothetical protein